MVASSLSVFLPLFPVTVIAVISYWALYIAPPPPQLSEQAIRIDCEDSLHSFVWVNEAISVISVLFLVLLTSIFFLSSRIQSNLFFRWGALVHCGLAIWGVCTLSINEEGDACISSELNQSPLWIAAISVTCVNGLFGCTNIFMWWLLKRNEEEIEEDVLQTEIERGGRRWSGKEFIFV
ncbi:hypothetical protein BDR26DRAFT_872021 [Obelidium mucronatum]|nr:hypothetical protein BDR26DRAFT_872021 [Obelidium mucronatum]